MTDSAPPNARSKVRKLELEHEHAYDDPTLDARGLLLAVMRDQRLPLLVRMDAASKLLLIPDTEPVVIYRWDAVTNAEYIIKVIIPDNPKLYERLKCH